MRGSATGARHIASMYEAKRRIESMEEKMEGTLSEVQNRGRYNVLKFRTAQGICAVSAFEGLPELNEGQEYAFTAVRVEKGGRQYLNLCRKAGKYEIAPKAAPKAEVGPASEMKAQQKAQESGKSGYWQMKDARITRMSCVSSAGAVVAAMIADKKVEGCDQAKALALTIAAAFEEWVLEAD